LLPMIAMAPAIQPTCGSRGCWVSEVFILI
jgi:hypothetical protein